jgi:hypothetical protein
MNPTKLAKFYDRRTGREVPMRQAIYGDGLIRDNVVMRVPMSLMDSTTSPPPARRPGNALARLHDALIRGSTRDAAGRLGNMHRPGYRIAAEDTRSSFEDFRGYGITDAQRQAVFDARAEYEHRLTTSYLGDAEGRQEGAACTVRNAEYPDDQGAPGHLRRVGGRLICVLDKPGDADNDGGYESSPEEIVENNSRHYENRPPHRRVDAASIAQQMSDHQERMADIYNKLDHELTEKWRQS